MVPKIISVFQLVLAVILIIEILLQQKGVGLGSAFGGSSNIYTTKKGIDKILFHATIVTAILFFGLGLASLLIA